MNSYENLEKLERKLRENGVYNSAAYFSSILNLYQINAETELFYSGYICKLPNCHIHQY